MADAALEPQYANSASYSADTPPRAMAADEFNAVLDRTFNDSAVSVSTENQKTFFIGAPEAGEPAAVVAALRHLARAQKSYPSEGRGALGLSTSSLGIDEAVAEAAQSTSFQRILAPGRRPFVTVQGETIPLLDEAAQPGIVQDILQDAAQRGGPLRVATRGARGAIGVQEFDGTGTRWRSADQLGEQILYAGQHELEVSVTPSGSLTLAGEVKVVEYRETRDEGGVETADERRSRADEIAPPRSDEDEGRGVRVNDRSDPTGVRHRYALTNQKGSETLGKGPGRSTLREVNEADTDRSRRRSPDASRQRLAPALRISALDICNNPWRLPESLTSDREESERRSAQALHLSYRLRLGGQANDPTNVTGLVNALSDHALRMVKEAGGENYTVVMQTEREGLLARSMMEWALANRFAAARGETLPEGFSPSLEPRDNADRNALAQWRRDINTLRDGGKDPKPFSAGTTPKADARDAALDRIAPPNTMNQQLRIAMLFSNNFPHQEVLGSLRETYEDARSEAAEKTAADMKAWEAAKQQRAQKREAQIKEALLAGKNPPPPTSDPEAPRAARPQDFYQFVLAPGSTTEKLVNDIRQNSPEMLPMIEVVGSPDKATKINDYDDQKNLTAMRRANISVLYFDQVHTTQKKLFADALRVGNVVQMTGQRGDHSVEGMLLRYAVGSTPQASTELATGPSGPKGGEYENLAIDAARLDSDAGQIALSAARITNEDARRLLHAGGMSNPAATIGTLRAAAESVAEREKKAFITADAPSWGAGSRDANTAAATLAQSLRDNLRTVNPSYQGIAEKVAEGINSLVESKTVPEKVAEKLAAKMTRRVAAEFGLVQEDEKSTGKDREGPSDSLAARLARPSTWRPVDYLVPKIQDEMLQFGLERLSSREETAFNDLAAQTKFSRTEALQRAVAGEPVIGNPEKDAAFKALATEVDAVRLKTVPAEALPESLRGGSPIYAAGNISLLTSPRLVATLGEPSDEMPVSMRGELAQLNRSADRTMEAHGAVRVRSPGLGDHGIATSREILVLQTGHLAALRDAQSHDIRGALAMDGLVVSSRPPMTYAAREAIDAAKHLTSMAEIIRGSSALGMEPDPKALNRAAKAAAEAGAAPGQIEETRQRAAAEPDFRPSPWVLTSAPTQTSPTHMKRETAQLAASLAHVVQVSNAGLHSEILPVAIEASIAGKPVMIPDNGLLQLEKEDPSRRAHLANAFAGTIALTVKAREALPLLPRHIDLAGLHDRPVARTYDPDTTGQSKLGSRAPVKVEVKTNKPTARPTTPRPPLRAAASR